MEQNRTILFRDLFHTMTGLKFKATANVTYKISFKQLGNQDKLLILRISEKVKAPKSAAKK